MLRIICCCTLIVILASSGEAERLRFQISGRSLPEAETDSVRKVDRYIKIYFTTVLLRKDAYLGRTETLVDSSNPQWNKIFDFDYYQAVKQKLHFKVYDRDTGRDNLIGEGFLNLEDYINSGEEAVVPLDKGFLIVQKP